MRVIARGRGQNAVVIGGERNLLADADDPAVDDRKSVSADQAVDERRVGILKNLLNSARELVGGLGPVVVFHRNHEDGLDLLCVCAEVACGKECERAEKPGESKRIHFLSLHEVILRGRQSLLHATRSQST